MSPTTCRLMFLVSGVIVALACGRQPAGPTPVGGTDATTNGLSAKPSASSSHTVTFAGGISGSAVTNGSITGVEGGTLRAQANGPYAWTIGRSTLLGAGDCEGQIGTLDGHGVLDVPLLGALTLDANEGNAFGERVTARLTGVLAGGATWEISIDTVGYPVDISGNTAAATANVPFTVIGFHRKRQPAIRCAVGFTVSVTRN